MPVLLMLYIAAYLDRVNIGFEPAGKRVRLARCRERGASIQRQECAHVDCGLTQLIVV